MSAQVKVERLRSDAAEQRLKPAVTPLPPQSPSAPPRSILSDIEIEYGPRDLLGRFFLQAEAAVRDRGITLSFAPIEELVAVNKANPDSWRPLLPIFDPSVGALTPETSFAILGRNAKGEVVATQAARLYDWTKTDFKREAESLRIFYKDPASQMKPGERCEISAAIAPEIFGRCVFSGAAWYRPDYRKRWLTGILPRMSRALAHTRWATDLTFTFMNERIVESGTATRVGYSKIDWAVTMYNARIADYYRCALLWMYTDEMIADLRTFMELPDAQVDPVVLHRTA